MGYTCEQMKEKIASMIDGNISKRDMEAVGQHLETCDECRGYCDAMKGDDKVLGKYIASLDGVVGNLKSNVTALLGDAPPAVRAVSGGRFGKRTAMSIAAAAAVILVVVLVSTDYLEPSGREVKPVASADVDTGAAIKVAPEAGVPLVIILPQALFAGTPKPTTGVKNLEPPRPAGQSRPTFNVPEGTANVALDKPVTSSSLAPIVGSLEMITDGDKEGADGSYVELDPFEQHITIDLGASCEIYAIVLWHYHKETAVYFDVVVQTADDPDFITNANVLFNNDTDNTHGLGSGSDKNYVDTYEGRLIDGKGTVGRYVRFYSTGNSENEMNHYIEVEIYGK